MSAMGEIGTCEVSVREVSVAAHEPYEFGTASINKVPVGIALHASGEALDFHVGAPIDRMFRVSLHDLCNAALHTIGADVFPQDSGEEGRG